MVAYLDVYAIVQFCAFISIKYNVMMTKMSITIGNLTPKTANLKVDVEFCSCHKLV